MIFKPTSSQLNFFTGNKQIDSYLWNQGIMQRFHKRYSYDELNAAYNSLVRVNDSLRIKSVYTDNGFELLLEEYQYKQYPHWILSSEEELKEKSSEFLNSAIDFSDALVRCAIFETPEVSGIMISGHHIVVDGYSVIVMTEQINRYLEDPQYVPSAYQKYNEYVEGEAKSKIGKRYELAHKFWEKEFTSVPSSLTMFGANKSIDYSSSEVNREIDCELMKKIASVCQKEEFSVQTFFNALYTVYFQRITENEKIVLGVPVLNRTTEAEFNTIGLYMHILPLVIERIDETFFCMAQRIENSQMNLFRYQKFTQYEIKEMLTEKGVQVDRLFDVSADYQEFNHNDSYEIRIPYSNSLSVPLEIHMQSFNGKKHNLKIRYRTSMFTEKEIKAMIDSIIVTAEDVFEHPDKKISELEMLSANEKQKLLYEFNSTAHSYNIPEGSTLYSLFENTAKANINKICIKTAEKNLTFGELLDFSESLDAEIRRITEGKKSVIAVIAERSPEMYSAIYGIIRGGNAYLPIDPEYPKERIEYILFNSGAKAVVVQDKFVDCAGKIAFVNMTKLMSKPKKSVADIPESCVNAEDTAYVIYTSGSTGNPKGAMVSHRSAVNRILWMHNKYPLLSDDIILQKTPYTFDVSVWEHFWWGICGGTLAVSNPGEHFLPAKILGEIYKNKVTHIHFVPSVFELFLNYLENNESEVQKFSSIKYVFLSGEALNVNLVKRFYALYSYENVSLHNLYGPTECAVDVTSYDCRDDEADNIPIGKPIYNTQIYIVDKQMNPVPATVKGELCIAGMNVGQGYLNNTELTNEKFVDNPFGGGKLYKSGDMAYWREDGNIIFCGRLDGQVKLGGQRIEIGEIESTILNCGGIDAVAVVIKKVNGRDVLAAFYCAENVMDKLILECCRKKLPSYMVPSIILKIEKMPLNHNGKTDRKALDSINIELNEEKVEKPENNVEKYICEEFARVLKKEEIGRNSDFFVLGGTSLAMISLLSEEKFSKITAAEFISNPTPALLAKLMENNLMNNKYLKRLYFTNSDKVLVLVPYAGGGAEAYLNLVDSLKVKMPDLSLYFLPFLHNEDEYCNAVRELEKELAGKKIYLYSHCVGYRVVKEILHRTERSGVLDVRHFIAGASVPMRNLTGKNIWNTVPDFMLQGILSLAGAPLKEISDKALKELLKKFRQDTDFAMSCFAEDEKKISCPMSLVLGKKDIFTLNYKKALKIWSLFATDIKGVYYTEAYGHYFQSENSEWLSDVIFSVIK